jgi:hypothetical protein
VQAPPPVSRRVRFPGSTRRREERARPLVAATPRSRQLSEQVPPRRLQELVALDYPLRTPPQRMLQCSNASPTRGKGQRSVRLDARELDDLGPLLSIVGDELSEGRGRPWKDCAAKVGKSRLRFGISQDRVNFLIEPIDDL